MALIKVKDLAYVRLRAPVLDVQEEFLTHFGLTRAARTPNALYMRGTGPRHHLHHRRHGVGHRHGTAQYGRLQDHRRRSNLVAGVGCAGRRLRAA